jgi:hypothetical protein
MRPPIGSYGFCVFDLGATDYIAEYYKIDNCEIVRSKQEIVNARTPGQR